MSGNLITVLTKGDLPDNSLIAVFNDIHIGIEDEGALKTCVEIAEYAGATHAIVNGDGHDCAAVSPHHGKKHRARVTTGQIREEIQSGRPFIEWLASRPALYGTGNHEDWINDLALETGTIGTTTVQSVLEIPPTINVLPHGYQIKIGSLVIEHGDLLLGRSPGGPGTAARVLARYPDQSTVFGHFHVSQNVQRTSPDRAGIHRSRIAQGLGHLSDPSKHWEYASRAPSWQQGFGLIRVYWVDGQARFTIYPVEIHRDKRNRPVAEYGGKVFRG